MSARKQKKKRRLLIALVCIGLLACSVSGVYAYLKDSTETLSNEFVPAKVTCSVEENFADGIKSNVQVRNTGNVDAYIRVAVVATFVSEDGKVLSTAPKEGSDYLVNWSATDWMKGTDGYWYYLWPVAPGETTTTLIESAYGLSSPADYRLHLQILASGVQSAPDLAVQDAWGVSVLNGEIIPR